MNDSKWIEFKLADPGRRTRKTRIWDIVAKGDGIALGQVRWFSRWYRYCFFPTLEIRTVFEETCLRDITLFLEEQTRIHKGTIFGRGHLAGVYHPGSSHRTIGAPGVRRRHGPAFEMLRRKP